MIEQEFHKRFARTVVVTISPHPDDSVLGAGGLIHRLTDTVAWDAQSGVSREDYPHVYTIVMTPGARGVDDEYLRRYALNRIRTQDSELADYLMLRLANGEQDADREKQLNTVREELRRQESTSEGRILRVKKVHFADLGGIYNEHSITDEDRESFKAILHEITSAHPDWKCVLLVPHRDDKHPVHMLSTTLTLETIESDYGWDSTEVWQYESPWITMTPNQVDIVVMLDGIGMATKSEAMAVHRSQEYRTKYSDVARYSAQMKAETLPELLGGFGSGEMGWGYVEAFQTLRPVCLLKLPEN